LDASARLAGPAAEAAQREEMVSSSKLVDRSNNIWIAYSSSGKK